LSKSNDFNITEDAQIFSLLPSITWQEMHRYYEYSNELIAQRDDESLPNLQFDTSSSVEEKDEPCDLSAIFRSGIVPVVHLSAKGYNIYDIETIMIYTILHKKKKYTRQEFVGFNKNHLGDLLDPMDNQVKHAFQYMVCRAQPETRKVQRLIYTPMWSESMLAYNVENYTFHASLATGRYRFASKAPSRYSRKTDEDIDHDSSSEQPVTIDQELDSPLEVVEELKKPAQREKPVRPVREKATALKEESAKLTTVKGRRERQSAASLTMEPPFEASEDLLAVFLLLENDLSILAGQEVKLDLSQLQNPNAQTVKLTRPNQTSMISLKLQKRRNNKIVPPTSRSLVIPAKASGSVIINVDYIDEVVHDENNDNPQLRITYAAKIIGQLTIELASHNVKMEIGATIHSTTSKLKCTLKATPTRKSQAKVKDSSDQKGEPKTSESHVAADNINPASLVEAVLAHTNAQTTTVISNCNSVQECQSSAVPALYAPTIAIKSEPSDTLPEESQPESMLPFNLRHIFKTESNQLKESAFFKCQSAIEPEEELAVAVVAQNSQAADVPPLTHIKQEKQDDPPQRESVIQVHHEIKEEIKVEVEEETVPIFTNQEESPPINVKTAEEEVIYPPSPTSLGSADVAMIDYESQILTRVIQVKQNADATTTITTTTNHQTPPTGPPPLHYRNIKIEPTEGAPKCLLPNPFSLIQQKTPTKDLKLQTNGDSGKTTTDVIDLTEDVVDLTNETIAARFTSPAQRTYSSSSGGVRSRHSDIAFVTCPAPKLEMFSSEVMGQDSFIKNEFSRTMNKVTMNKNSLLNAKPSSIKSIKEQHNIKKGQVRMFNVMECIDKNNLKTTMNVKANIVPLKLPPKVSCCKCRN